MRGRSHSYFAVVFLLFLALSLISVGLTVLLASVNLTDGLTDFLTRDALETLRGAEKEYDGLLDSLEDSLGQLTSSPEVSDYLRGGAKPYDIELLRTLYGVRNAYGGMVEVHLVSASCPAGVSTTAIPQEYLYPYNSVNWGVFRKIAGGENTLTACLDRQKSACFLMGAALKDEAGETLGYALLEADRELVEERLMRFASGGNQNVVLCDSYGLVLYNTDGADGEGFDGARALFESGVVDLAEMGQGEGVLPMEDGVYVRNPRTGMVLLSSVSTDLLGIASHYITLSIRAAAGILLVFIFVAAWLLTKSLRKPFRELQTAIGRVEKGDFSARAAEDGFREVASLCKSFNHMAGNLEELIRNIEENQRMLRTAQINALQLQINPHFLYNTLDLIKWLARENNMRAVSATTVSLARLLRKTLDLENDIATVESEIDLIENYISIQLTRYEDRLSCEIDVPEEVKNCLMPKMLLLPIVENSIIHGLENKLGRGHIQIGARREGRYLRFSIQDDGMGMSPETLSRVEQMRQDGMYGIGLSNVNKRSRMFGDENCGVVIQSELGKGTLIRLTILCTESKEGEQMRD